MPARVLATNLKVSGVPVFSAGDFEGAGAETDRRARRRAAAPTASSCCAMGVWPAPCWSAIPATRSGMRDLIRSGASVSAFREALAFGQAFAEAA